MVEKGVLSQSKMYFHTPSDFAKEALFYLSYSGTFCCSNDYIVERNNWNSYLFMFVKKGKMRIFYEEKEYMASENSFVFLNCYKPHKYQAEEETVFDWIHFSGNASEAYYNLLYEASGCVFSIANNYVIQDYMTSILHAAKENHVEEDAVSIYIHKILYELKKKSSEVDSLQFKSILEAINYIESSFHTQIKLQDIANCAGLSPYHFSRVFKKHLNCSPYQYLINFRINHAKELLQNTDLSIQEITYECGFNSVPHFIKIFKEHTELTPKKFRNLPF